MYFAGYKKIIDRYKVEEIEAAADVVIWCCDEAPGFTPDRVQDRSFVGNIVQAMVAYASGELGEVDDSVQYRGSRDRDRLGRHDECRREGSAWRAAAVPEARTIMRSAASTRRCSA